jgi:hypothetical protein
MLSKPACGNDCESCPRYIATKSGEESRLRDVAVLWKSVGWRAEVVSPEEIACNGCESIDWCRYGVRGCAQEHGVNNCGQCREYPCETVVEMLAHTRAYIDICRQNCTPEDFAVLEKAFFSKKDNLEAARR